MVKGKRRRERQRKRLDNIKDRTGLEFGESVKGKGLLFNVGNLRKSPPGVDGTTNFHQSPRCVALSPRLSSLDRYCWQQYQVGLSTSTE